MLLWTAIAVAAHAFGWSDADERVRAHILARDTLPPETTVRVWFQLELPLDGLDVLLAKVVRGTEEGPGEVCFALDALRSRGIEGAGPSGWVGCQPGERFERVVDVYNLGAKPKTLSDFDWLRLFVLGHDGVCGDPSDLLAANPRIPTRFLTALPAPSVERPTAGGVELQVGCVVGTEVQSVTVEIAADDGVTVTREVVGELRAAAAGLTDTR